MVQMEKVEYGSQYLPIPAKIAKIETLTENEKLYTLELPDGLPFESRPCQFVMVSLYGFGEAPISIASGPDDRDLVLCIRKVGSLTNKIHELKEGDIVGIRGPYGNGFPVEKLEGKDLLFVAGGLGLAPLRSLIRYVLAHRRDFGEFTLFYGCKTQHDRLFINEIEEWENRDDINFHETVDIGDLNWNKNVGLITSLFKFFDNPSQDTMAFIVGPPVMYRFVIRELLKKGVLLPNIYMDLERRMRCGLGKCGHCQMNAVYVCQDGPVFNYHEMIEQNLREAL